MPKVDFHVCGIMKLVSYLPRATKLQTTNKQVRHMHFLTGEMQPKSEINTIRAPRQQLHHKLYYFFLGGWNCWILQNLLSQRERKKIKNCEGKWRISYNNWECSNFPNMESSRLIVNDFILFYFEGFNCKKLKRISIIGF